MSLVEKKVKVLNGYNHTNIPFKKLSEPVILRGLVGDWGLVKAGKSAQAAMEYLKQYSNNATVSAFYGDKNIDGRYFYKNDLSEINFERKRLPFDQVLADIDICSRDAQAGTVYMGSTTVDGCLPRFRSENDLVFDEEYLGNANALMSIWIGNRSLISAHYDAPDNIACCAVGRRRFTLFPPEQIQNLYPGPLEPTPGGQAVSMVDFANPDFDRYPRFREALKAGLVADLEPGDAIFYPSLWWHQVEAFDSFNVLVNYWWTTAPSFMGSPMNVLNHAMLTLRDRPEHEKQAWKYLFEYYVFGPKSNVTDHLPSQALGNLDSMDDVKARRLRANLLRSLNR